MAHRNAPLFAHPGSPERALIPERGILVTNHLNLMYMLSAGLIMSPGGFAAKYYQDTLGSFSGWIPLFMGKVFADAVSTAVQEADHLRPCLAQVNLHHLAGPIHVLRGDDMVSIRFPVEIDGTEQVLFVPAPLPAVWIEDIVFRSRAEMAACNADARDYNNVPWTGFKRRSNKSMFAQTLPDLWPPASKLSERAVPLAASLAAGGSMAMLLQVANQGDPGVAVCRTAFDLDAPDKAAVQDPILAGLEPWLRHGRAQANLTISDIAASVSGARELQGQLFWEIVDCLVHCQSTSDAASAEDTVLNYLEEKSGQMQETRLKQKVVELLDALESLTGLGAVGTTEMFERHPTPFSRAMTLLFLRRNCMQLLEFRHPLLTEADWLTSALLFGVRSGWQELPLELRNTPGLTRAVSHRMAALAQTWAETGLDLGTPPPRCRPMRELFMSDWSKRHQEAARYLAQKRNWDCIQFAVHLRHGQYELRVSRSGIQIWADTAPSIAYEVDAEHFLENLAHAQIDVREVQKIYGILKI